MDQLTRTDCSWKVLEDSARMLEVQQASQEIKPLKWRR